MNDSAQANLEHQVIAILRSVLNLGAGRQLDASSALLGSIAELDSMAVVSIITGLEESFGIVVDDDEVDGRTFATVGSLVDFVADKIAR